MDDKRCVCICMCVIMCRCAWVCMHVCTCVCMCEHVCGWLCLYMYICKHGCACLCSCVSVYVHTCVYICVCFMRVCMHMHVIKCVWKSVCQQFIQDISLFGDFYCLLIWLSCLCDFKWWYKYFWMKATYNRNCNAISVESQYMENYFKIIIKYQSQWKKWQDLTFSWYFVIVSFWCNAYRHIKVFRKFPDF